MSVDLPAPFSPTMACTVPLSTVREMSLLATTPGNRFVMPSSRTAGAPWWTALGGSPGLSPVTGALLTMTHTPHAGPPRRGRRSSIEPAPPTLARPAVAAAPGRACGGNCSGGSDGPDDAARAARAVQRDGGTGRSPCRAVRRSGLRDRDL